MFEQNKNTISTQQCTDCKYKSTNYHYYLNVPEMNPLRNGSGGAIWVMYGGTKKRQKMALMYSNLTKQKHNIVYHVLFATFDESAHIKRHNVALKNILL